MYRQLSALEATYLATNTIDSSPMVNQLIVEGDYLGSNIHYQFSQEQWQTAVAYAAEKNPAIKLALKGYWGWRYWSINEHNTPKVMLIKDCNWSGNSSENYPFTNQPINPRKDPLAEVYLLQSAQQKPRVIFRTHHALTDGMGTLHWIQEVFRALRGEPLQGSDGRLNELLIVKQQTNFPAYNFKTGDSMPVFIKNKKNEQQGCHWYRIQINHNGSKIIPKFIVLLYQLAKQQLKENATNHRFLVRIPADLRRYIDKNDTDYHLGNCTSIIDLEITDEMTVNDLQKQIVRSMRQKKDVGFIALPAMKLMRWIPKFLIQTSSESLVKLHQQEAYPFSVNISNVGKLDLKNYSYPEFQSKAVYGIPIPLENRPFFVGIAINKGLQVTLGIPKAHCSAKDFQQFCDDLKRNIEK